VYKIFVRNPQGKKGRPRHKFKDDIKIDIMKIRYDWVNLTHDKFQFQALISVVMNLQIP